MAPYNSFIAETLSVIARVANEHANQAHAVQLGKQALAMLEKTLGPEHDNLAQILNDLAKLYIAQYRYAEAQSLCQRAVDICEKMLGPEHSETITYRETLSRIISKVDEAEG